MGHGYSPSEDVAACRPTSWDTPRRMTSIAKYLLDDGESDEASLLAVRIKIVSGVHALNTVPSGLQQTASAGDILLTWPHPSKI